MLATIIITVDTDKMVNFFNKDISYGQRNRPYKADCFCQITHENVTNSGIPYVFMLKEDTIYKFQLLNTTGSINQIVPDTATFNLSMIKTNIPNEDDWRKIIDLDYNQPNTGINGSLIYNIEDGKSGNYFFSIKTQPHFKSNYNLQYHITFQIMVKGQIMLSEIDPLIANYSDDE